MIIKDKRGKIPNYVLTDGVMRHQPTGLEVNCDTGASDRELIDAHGKLKTKIRKKQGEKT
jgi:hypothetical protein